MIRLRHEGRITGQDANGIILINVHDGAGSDPLPWEAAFPCRQALLGVPPARPRSPLPDFYIGAHAAVAGFRLLHGMRAAIAPAFPSVTLICPT